MGVVVGPPRFVSLVQKRETSMKINLRYGSYEADMEVTTYHNGRTAIQLYDAEDGSPLMTASVNIPELAEVVIEHLCERLGIDKKRFVLIKNWSENEGILMSLEEAGVIDVAKHTIPTGYCHANVAFLKEDLCT